MFRHDQPVQQRGWLRLVLIVAAVVVVSLGLSYVALNMWYQDNLEPVTNQQVDDVVVVIDSGTSVRDIGDQLKELGVIRNATVFAWYVGQQDARSDLQAGTYRLNPAQSVEEIVDVLVNGDVATNLYTIFPGKRIDELREDFIGFGFSGAEVDTALNRRYSHPLFAGLPTNASLEGYIYPETYEITAGSTVENILTTSFDEFSEQLTPELLANLDKQGMNLHEAVTLASIVQLESSNLDDQRTIAQVFHSRLEQGMTLGSDPTFFYAAAVTNQTPAVDLDHPYNTRIYEGLPPGPISNFNLSALEAVGNPTNTDFLFFMASDEGVTYFAKTFEDHQVNIDRYCGQACILPQ